MWSERKGFLRAGTSVTSLAFGIVLLGVVAHREQTWRSALESVHEIQLLGHEVGAQRVKPTIVLVFQGEDCRGIASAILALNEVARDGHMSVVGGLLGSFSEVDAPLFRSAYGIDFPVSPIDETGAAFLGNALGYDSTPFLVAVDREGQVLAAGQAETAAAVEVVLAWASVAREAKSE